eukprot:SAG31_NODE_1100_length_9905_cov_17.003977_2_plen_636_part_00
MDRVNIGSNGEQNEGVSRTANAASLKRENTCLRERLGDDRRKLGRLTTVVRAIEADFAAVEHKRRTIAGGTVSEQHLGAKAREQAVERLELEQALLIRQNQKLRERIRDRHPGSMRGTAPMCGEGERGDAGCSARINSSLDEPSVLLLVDSLLQRHDQIHVLKQDLVHLHSRCALAGEKVEDAVSSSGEVAPAKQNPELITLGRKLHEYDAKIAIKKHKTAELEANITALTSSCKTLITRVDAAAPNAERDHKAITCTPIGHGAEQLTLAKLADRLQAERNTLLMTLKATHDSNRKLALAHAAAMAAAKNGRQTCARLAARQELLKAQAGCQRLLLTELQSQLREMRRVAELLQAQTDETSSASRKLLRSRDLLAHQNDVLVAMLATLQQPLSELQQDLATDGGQDSWIATAIGTRARKSSRASLKTCPELRLRSEHKWFGAMPFHEACPELVKATVKHSDGAPRSCTKVIDKQETIPLNLSTASAELDGSISDQAARPLDGRIIERGHFDGAQKGTLSSFAHPAGMHSSDGIVDANVGQTKVANSSATYFGLVEATQLQSSIAGLRQDAMRYKQLLQFQRCSEIASRQGEREVAQTIVALHASGVQLNKKICELSELDEKLMTLEHTAHCSSSN